MKTIPALVMALAFAHPLAAQPADARQSVLAARDTVWHAWFANDTALLRRYIPPAAATYETKGGARWSDRATILDGARGFAGTKARLLDVSFTNTDVTFTGAHALVHANFRTVVEQGGKRDTNMGRATELFVRVGTTWVNPYWSLEPLPAMRGVARAIPLSDTLGANFDIADSAKAMGTMADYDTLIGTWEFRFQGRNPDGTFNNAFTGHWNFDKRPGGGLIEDHWRPDDPESPMGLSLYTYRLFDPERKVWQMIGTWSGGGTIQPGLTWSDGTYRYAIQRANGSITRIRYLAIAPSHFLWRSDRSIDGGKTWIRDFGTMEATRIGK